MEKFKEEEDYVEEQINVAFKEFLKWPKSITLGVSTNEGELIRTPLKGYATKKYARILAPFAKRCITIAKCLEPLTQPLAFTVWTKRATYTIVVEEDFFVFGVQKALVLPKIPPKPMEEISETERNEKRDKEIKMIRKLKQERLKALAEEAKKPKEPEKKKAKKQVVRRTTAVKSILKKSGGVFKQKDKKKVTLKRHKKKRKHRKKHKEKKEKEESAEKIETPKEVEETTAAPGDKEENE